MKTYGVEVEIHIFLTLVLDADEWSVLCHFSSGEAAPSGHCVGSWVCSRAGLDALEKLNISVPAGNQIPIPQTFSL
jgi:hypothetical protein